MPFTLYCTNLSVNDTKCEWFIKLPGTDFIRMSNIESPAVDIYHYGTTYIRLKINDDDSLTKTYSIDVYSLKDTPKILTPLIDQKLEKTNIKLSWQEGLNLNKYLLSIFNETKKKLIYYEKKINKNDFMFPRGLIDEGCKYKIRVESVDPLNDIVFFDESSFFIDGKLDMRLKPAGIDNTLDLATVVNSNVNIFGRLRNAKDIDYYKFEIPDNSNFELTYKLDRGTNINIDIESKDGATQRCFVTENKKFNEYSNVLKAGTFYLKVYKKSKDKNPNDYQIKLNCSKYNPKLLLIYVGYGYMNYPNEKFGFYSDEDIKRMVNSDKTLNTNEFLIVTGSQGGYGAHEAVLPGTELKVVDTIKTDVTGRNPDNRSAIKNEILNKLLEYKDINNNGVKEKNPSRIPLDRTLNTFVDDSVTLALRIIKEDKKAKIWFCFPIHAQPNIAEYYIKPYKEEIIAGIKKRLDKVNKNIWFDNIIGFYYSNEDIPRWYTLFDKNEKNFIRTNPIVKTMNALSTTVKNQYKKMMLWIPYLGDSPGNIERVGYVANETNIFDYVLVQPTRYWDSSGYISQNSGDTQITFKPELADQIKDQFEVNVSCEGAKRLIISVYNRRDIKICEKSVDDFEGTISFKPGKGLYTINVEAVYDSGNKYYCKAVIFDKNGTWRYNLDTVARSTKENAVYYVGSNGKDGKIVAPKTSRTKIGYEMEVDAYAFADPNIIRAQDINLFLNEKTDEASKLRYKYMREEMAKYYKYQVLKKTEFYNAYLKTFKNLGKGYPVGFFAGDRREVLESLNNGITVDSDRVFNIVSDFFGDA